MFLVDTVVVVFEGSAEVWPVIKEACDSRVVFCEDMDDCWKTYDSWVGLITELFNVVGTVITSDDNSFLF